jgi:cell division transport system permease protein
MTIVVRRRVPNHLIPDQEGANRYLPWVIAVMVFLGALAIAVSATLNRAVFYVEDNVRGSITVELPAVAGDQDARVKRALILLRSTAGVISARPLEKGEMVALLEPWLGRGNVSDELPIPQLIDIKLDEDYPADIVFLEQRLQKEVPGARVDDHQFWLGKFSRFSAIVQWLTLGAIGLVIATIAIVVVFSAHAALASHRAIVELLHLIGAHDQFVAQHFQRSALMLGLKGGLLGTLIAGIVIAVLWQSVGNILPQTSSWTANLILIGLLVLLPLVAAFTASITVRLAVMRKLRRMP